MLPQPSSQAAALLGTSLYSVRSGSPTSMPGMLRTILNVGFDGRPRSSDDDTRFALAAYLRYLLEYADLVMEPQSARILQRAYGSRDGNLIDHREASKLRQDLDQLESQLSMQQASHDLRSQLATCIEGVMRSWLAPKAQQFRRQHIKSLPDDSGTAVIVQQMVYGNYNDRSGSGVAYSRDPSTGEHHLSGNFLAGTQGEDVVSGEVELQQIDELEKVAPAAYEELRDHCEVSERMLGSVAEVEFTVQDGQLWLLQARRARLSGAAVVRFAHDSVNVAGPGGTERWTTDEALLWEELTSTKLLQATAPQFANPPPLGWRGMGVSPGAATGRCAFDAQGLEKILQGGDKAIWVAKYTTTEELENIRRCAGVVTTTKGMSSHSIVVARGWGLPVVTGVVGEIAGSPPELVIKDPDFEPDQEYFPGGQVISIDGATGDLYKERLEIVDADQSAQVMDIIDWCQKAIGRRGPALRVNADTAKQAELGIRSGAEGVGLARLEGLLDSDSNLSGDFAALAVGIGENSAASTNPAAVQEITNNAAYRSLQDRLTAAYTAMFKVTIDANPRRRCVVRLVDELSPGQESFIRRGLRLPDIGHIRLRGAQIFVLMTPLVMAQVDALVKALQTTRDRRDAAEHLEILVPFCMSAKEFRRAAAFTRSRFRKEFGDDAVPLVGAMLETPRSLILAREYVTGPESADFVSLGLNDLTELVMGLVQVEPLVKTYQSEGILTIDPLTGLDRAVSSLVQSAVAAVQEALPGIEIHVASEQVNDGQSAEDLVRLGASVLSCGPKQFDGLQLAVAKALIKERRQELSNMAGSA